MAESNRETEGVPLAPVSETHYAPISPQSVSESAPVQERIGDKQPANSSEQTPNTPLTANDISRELPLDELDGFEDQVLAGMGE